MCGFLGEFSEELSGIEDFRKILQSSSKRGPDQQAIWTDDQVIRIGFNRLSILDVSENGKQPIISPSGRFVLVINGEIYNYRQLRNKYGIPESALRSTSDSAVVSFLLDQLPVEKLVAELNGMFAIAIYDRETRKLILARDFAGIKPLYYGMRNNTVVFASQFDQVFRHPAFSSALQVDVNCLYDYVALGYMHAPGTVFQNIFQCQPGEIIQFDTPHATVSKKFCVFPQNNAGKAGETDSDTIGHLNDVLNQVVKDQLVADVPVGLFLSGGIDSPLIAAYAKKFKSDITAYTIGVSDSHLDESEQASVYAKSINVQHKIIHFEENELLKFNDEHFNSLNVPFGDYSSLPTYLVTQIARQNNTVMLSGDGGDELFWGYPRFLNVVNHFNWFGFPKGIRTGGAGLMRRAGRRVSFGVSNHDTVEKWVLAQQCHNSPKSLESLLPGLGFSSEILKTYTPVKKITSKEDLLQWLRWNEFYGHLQRVLAKVDLTSMGNSLEVRVPFLDKRMIEFAWDVKPGLGISHQNPKTILKNLLGKNLGTTVINNKKRGFSVPIRRFLRKELKQDFRNHLLDVPLFGEPLWNKKELENKVNLFLEHDQENEWGMWILYAMQKWATRYQLN